MKHLPLLARLLLGLIFFAFGVNGLFQLNLLPMPENVPPNMEAYMAGLAASGYFFPLLKMTEIICGAFLLLGVFVPLALVVLAPVVLNIILTHIFVMPEDLWLALLLGVLNVYLAFFVKPYSNVIKRLFCSSYRKC